MGFVLIGGKGATETEKTKKQKRTEEKTAAKSLKIRFRQVCVLIQKKKQPIIKT